MAPLALSQSARVGKTARAAARPARRAVVCQAQPEKKVAQAAVVGALLASIASPAFAVVATEADIAAVKAEFETRSNACTTEDCKRVIKALETRKLSKLTGGAATGMVMESKAAPVLAEKPVPKPAPEAPKPKKAEPAPAPKPAPAPAKKAVAAAPPQVKDTSAADAAKAKAEAAKAEAAKAEAAKAEAAKAKAAAAAAADAKANAAASVKAKEAAAKAKAEATLKAEKEKAAKAAAEKKKKEAEKKKSGNIVGYEFGFAAKGALAAGAVAAPFIYLKKDEVLVDESGAINPEKLIGKLKDTAEQVPNQGAVVAYGAAGLVALSLVDGIINLPLLNFFIGGPVQILGLATAVALGLRYFKEGKSYPADFKNAHAKINSLIPADLPEALPKELAKEWEEAK